MIAVVAALLVAAVLPEPLRPLAEAKAKNGAQILTADDLQRLSALPERTLSLLAAAADSQLLGSAEQLHALLSLDLSPGALELVAQDNCILCHSDPVNQNKRTLFSIDPKKAGSNPLLDLRELVSDAHFRRGLSCAGCHGGAPTDDSMSPQIAQRWPSRDERHQDRSWIPGFCARCHADPAFMRGFNPTLPTDQLAKYRESRHGILLLQQNDSGAAQCVSCHGVHGIRGPKSRRSTVSPQRIPETCGACHADPKHMAGYTTDTGEPIPTNQLSDYRASVHGKALLEKGDLGAPSCTGCHGSHAAMPPSVASVAQVCRRCHAQNGALFDGSKHKVAFESRGWPECGQCHGKHGIQRPTDALVGNRPGTLCHDCHSREARDNTRCDETAGAMRVQLDALASGRNQVAPQQELLAQRGLDVEPLAQSVSDLDEALQRTRSSVHAFDLGTFQRAAAPGVEALGKAHASIAEARRDARFRRSGLFAAIGFIGLLAVGIALKIRDLERRRNGNGAGP